MIINKQVSIESQKYVNIYKCIGVKYMNIWTRIYDIFVYRNGRKYAVIWMTNACVSVAR